MHGMQIFDAFVTEAQGEGLSLRIFAQNGKAKEKTERYRKLKHEETKNKLNTVESALNYGKACKDEARRLRSVVEKLKQEGKRIAGYGAAAKGFSVLQLAGIDGRHIDYFVDDSPAKQGKYTPVTRIPIISREDADHILPDYFFITAPNYADVIIRKESDFVEAGGRFILCDSSLV